MHTRVVQPRRGPEILVRPLRNGDVDTVWAVFARLGEESRRTRFLGPKLRLSETELEWLAQIGPDHHALVASVDGDPEPIAIARLVRLGGGRAEIAFEVADTYQGLGVGSALARLLVEDARTAGICEVTALVRSDNPAALALLRRVLGRVELRLEGPDMIVRALLPGCA